MKQNQIILLFIGLFLSYSSLAQFKVGSGGITIKGNATIVIDRLQLQPWTDINIQNNTLLIENTPIPGTPMSSINRVYKWLDTVTTNGMTGIYIKTSELNGNNINALQLNFCPTDNDIDFLYSGFSLTNNSNNFVFEPISNTVWKRLTAVELGSYLPLELLNFSGEKVNQHSKLFWQMANEKNITSYDIQRSADGINFSEIGKVNAKCHGCLSSTDYIFYDKNPIEGKNFYRLKINTTENNNSFSNTIVLHFNSPEYNISLMPNPFQDYIKIIGLEEQLSYQLKIFDVHGKLIIENPIQNKSTFNISTLQLIPGNYMVILQDSNGVLWQSKVVKL